MRTTLDLDPAVLSAARARAQAQGISIGRALSDISLRGLDLDTASADTSSGFPVLRGAPGHVVTDELVAEHRDDEPEECCAS
ncbi:DUF2191 domain-containing protein [Brachybacterium sp. UMB0905]|nr:DUF2191 domain-containing protein [Brachybacterium sp. UMB0905]